MQSDDLIVPVLLDDINIRGLPFLIGTRANLNENKKRNLVGGTAVRSGPNETRSRLKTILSTRIA